MFNPSQADVRQFFCAVYAKNRAGAALQPLETIASLWIDEHPEYHLTLAHLPTALHDVVPVPDATKNAFLHLSMHLSITEQCSIDQPRGIRQAVELLTHRLDSLHAAHHVVMESLGDMLWQSQRSGKPPDGQSYVAKVQRRATQD